MTGKVDKPGQFIAVGLSDDDLMGDDSVTDCRLLTDGKVVTRQSWNILDYENELLASVKGIEEIGSGTNEDGQITCKWKRSAKTEVKGKKFDMGLKSYYILLAKGDLEGGEYIRR